MKRIITSLAIMVLAFVAFTAPSFAADQQDLTTSYAVSEAAVIDAEEALHCKTNFPDGTSAECWFCKCPMTQPQAPAPQQDIQE